MITRVLGANKHRVNVPSEKTWNKVPTESLLYLNIGNRIFGGMRLPFCWKCGAEMKDDAKFCPKCGASVSRRVRREKEREWWE